MVPCTHTDTEVAHAVLSRDTKQASDETIESVDRAVDERKSVCDSWLLNQ